MIELLTEQANDVQFNLQMEGGTSYDVFFTIFTEGLDYRFKAVQEASGAWSAAIPSNVELPAGSYNFAIDVVMDNHIYPAVQDHLVVKAKIKAVASVVESKPHKATPIAPVVKFLPGAGTPPGRRAK